MLCAQRCVSVGPGCHYARSTGPAPHPAAAERRHELLPDLHPVKGDNGTQPAPVPGIRRARSIARPSSWSRDAVSCSSLTSRPSTPVGPSHCWLPLVQTL
uniref:Uncharacterized protein n=1 Tax=Strigops habroptila TaxID=2489341 RepID=A0A672UH83_STRHB